MALWVLGLTAGGGHSQWSWAAGILVVATVQLFAHMSIVVSPGIGSVGIPDFDDTVYTDYGVDVCMLCMSECF